MNTSQFQPLIQLLNGKSIDFESVNDKKSLLKFIQQNGVGGLIHHLQQNAQHPLPLEIANGLKQIRIQDAFAVDHKIATFKQIVTLFNQHQINVMPLKGLLLSLFYYSEPGFRPMGDVDLLVPTHQVKKAQQLLMQNGGELSSCYRSAHHEMAHAHVGLVNLNGINVELHHHLFNKGSQFYFDIQKFWNDATPTTWSGAKLYLPSVRSLLLHLEAHLYETSLMGGIRLGWFYDLKLVSEKLESESDFNFLKEWGISHKQIQLLNDIHQQQRMLWAEESPLLQNPIALESRQKGSKRGGLFYTIKANLGTHSPWLTLQLFWFDLFPAKEYMKYRYNATTWNARFSIYLKRLLKIPSFFSSRTTPSGGK